MIRPRKPWLDWRREKEAISEVLSRQGGVVRVQAGAAGPLIEFSNALRSHLDHGTWVRPWTTIQFDPDNANTRYFGEMTRQIERSLALPPDEMPTAILGSGSKVGSDLKATEITITNSFNFGHSEYDQSVIHERRARRIVQEIASRIEHESFCFLFLNSEGFNRYDLESFRNLLWVGGLRDLSTNGVMLVDLTRSNPRSDIEWPPSTPLNLVIADEYDSQSREHAIVDLSAFLLESGFETTDPEARAYSRAMLDNHKGPVTLYSQLAAVFAFRGQGS